MIYTCESFTGKEDGLFLALTRENIQRGLIQVGTSESNRAPPDPWALPNGWTAEHFDLHPLLSRGNHLQLADADLEFVDVF